jgi:cell division protein FtsB
VSVRETILAVCLLLTGAGALGIAFLGNQGVGEIKRLRAEREHLSDEIARLREKRRAMEREIEKLRGDPGAIEERARRELGMIRQGETVFLLPERHGDR